MKQTGIILVTTLIFVVLLNMTALALMRDALFASMISQRMREKVSQYSRHADGISIGSAVSQDFVGN